MKGVPMTEQHDKVILEFEKGKESKYWNTKRSTFKCNEYARDNKLKISTVHTWYDRYFKAHAKPQLNGEVKQSETIKAVVQKGERIRVKQIDREPKRVIPTFDEIMDFQIQLMTDYNKLVSRNKLLENQNAIYVNEIVNLKQDIKLGEIEKKKAIDELNGKLTKALQYKAQSDQMLAQERE